MRSGAQVIASMVADGTLRSVIDRRYPLADAPQALLCLAEGHARGKVVIGIPG